MSRKLPKPIGSAVAAAVVLLDVLFMSAVYRDGSRWPTLAALLIGTVVLVARHTYLAHYRPFHTPAAKPDDPDAGVALAGRLQQESGDSPGPSAGEAMAFAGCLVRPDRFRRRIVEECVPQGRTLRKTVTVDLEIPERFAADAAPEHVHLPILIGPKGDLLDDFTVRNTNNEETPWLTRGEYLTLVTKVLRVLLSTSEQRAPGEGLSPDATKAERRAIECIVRRSDPRHDMQVDHSGAEAIARLEVDNPVAQKMAVLFVQALSGNDAVVVRVRDVDGSRRHRVTYGVTLIPTLVLERSRRSPRWSGRGFLQVALGAGSSKLFLDISNAATCQSYHLYVRAPDGCYLAHQALRDVHGTTRQQVDPVRGAPHWRFRERLGQPYAHFHARHFPTADHGRRPGVELAFDEIPPGSTMRATITALAALAILWMIGFAISKGTDSQAPGTDAPAFLLVFPALAATWLGLDAPSRVVEVPMSARLSVLITLVLSVMGTGLYVLHKSLGHGFDAKVPGGQSILGVSDLTWAVVVAGALLNVLWIGYRCVVQIWAYLTCLTADPTK
ncbi:hypothetical protein [Actinosynnema sp. NPDC020468]|uniref:hypothetical protein n=1 Tax=Actinosynnema sp. NPDC020468 TaxID=3154488 RepID=UPI0033FE58EC